MILATVGYNLLVLKELVRAGADLNLQNQVTSPLKNKSLFLFMNCFI